MIELRPFEKLGKSDHGWLNANFHFSFADYRNPKPRALGRAARLEQRPHRAAVRLSAASRIATWRS